MTKSLIEGRFNYTIECKINLAAFKYQIINVEVY
jgi:hypothetical protein